MKNKLTLLVITLLLGGQALLAQTDFRPGFVVLNSGDTTSGEIDYRGDHSMSAVCRFRERKEGEVIKFEPGEIQGYGFIDSKYFTSREVETEAWEKTVFLEFLVKSALNLYYNRDDAGNHFYIDKEGMPLVELPYKENTREVNGKIYTQKSKDHIGILKLYMQDAPDLYKQIEELEKLDRAKLMRLAKAYHRELDKDNKPVVFNKNRVLVKVHPELFAGHITYTSDVFFKGNYFHRGALFHIQMPNINEKLFFKTGVMFSKIDYVYYPTPLFGSRVDYERKKHVYFKIPVHFEYQYPKGWLRPKLSYGVNFYQNFALLTNSMSAGLNIKLYKKWFLSVNSDVEFVSKTIVLPTTHLGYSFYAGIYLNL